MEQHLWWQRGIIYQIYPWSFMDANGDGVGDLPGITSKLDYLQWLGIDAIWISPIYPSPMVDFGYDVSDYCNIDPVFGTLADFDALLAQAHARGIRVILDLIPNHTSDQHPWFIASRSARDNPKRDWYLWRHPAPDSGPPNNWRSHFGGSGWTLDENSGQYYYHTYFKEQPELNWRNPEVQAAIFDVMRFWLARGADGFRVDVIWRLLKDPEFRDNPPNPHFVLGQNPYYELLSTYTGDLPEVHTVIAAMRRVVDEYPERVMIGEIYLPPERLMAYYGAPREIGGTGVHLPYNFQLIGLPWDARTIARAMNAYEAMLPTHAWPNWVLGNHDRHRIASRVGLDQARVAAMLLLTLRGTPTIYYGDEIGMHDVPIPPERVQDPYERNIPGLGLGRDPERTPMQWSLEPNAGFTTRTPWLPIAEDYRTCNVEVQDPPSMLTLHRSLIALRRAKPALAIGEYAPLEASGDLVAYVRKHEARRFAIVLNLGVRAETFELESPRLRGRVVLSTHLDREEVIAGVVTLRPNEGVIIEVA